MTEIVQFVSSSSLSSKLTMRVWMTTNVRLVVYTYRSVNGSSLVSSPSSFPIPKRPGYRAWWTSSTVYMAALPPHPIHIIESVAAAG